MFFRVVSGPLKEAQLALGMVPILAHFIDILRDSFKGTSRYLLTSLDSSESTSGHIVGLGAEHLVIVPEGAEHRALIIIIFCQVIPKNFLFTRK